MTHCCENSASQAPLAEFFASIADLPTRHPRRVGLFLMQLGMGALLPALCLGLAVMHGCFVVASVGFILAKPPIDRLPGFWCAVAFTFWQGLSMALTVLLGLDSSPNQGGGMLFLWSALYLAQVAFADPMVRTRAVYLLMVAVVCSAILACAQYVIGLGGGNLWRINPNGKRFHQGVGFAPVHLTQGFIMSLALLVLADAQVVAGNLKRVALWIARGAALVGVVISNARMVFFGLPLAFAARVMANGGRKRLLWATVIVLAGMLVAANVIAALTPGRLMNMLQGVDGRFPIWRTSVAIVAQHPVLGTGGTEAFKREYSRLYPSAAANVPNEFPRGAPHAHNSVLSIAAMHGIPAALLYLFWVATLLLSAFRGRAGHPQRWALTLAILVLTLTAGLFENLVGHSAPAYASFVILGMVLAIADVRQVTVKEALTTQG